MFNTEADWIGDQQDLKTRTWSATYAAAINTTYSTIKVVIKFSNHTSSWIYSGSLRMFWICGWLVAGLSSFFEALRDPSKERKVVWIRVSQVVWETALVPRNEGYLHFFLCLSLLLNLNHDCLVGFKSQPWLSSLWLVLNLQWLVVGLLSPEGRREVWRQGARYLRFGRDPSRGLTHRWFGSWSRSTVVMLGGCHSVVAQDGWQHSAVREYG